MLFLGVVCVQITDVLRGATRQRHASDMRFAAHVALHGRGNKVLVYLLRVLVPTKEINGALAPLKNYIVVFIIVQNLLLSKMPRTITHRRRIAHSFGLEKLPHMSPEQVCDWDLGHSSRSNSKCCG